MTGDNLQKVPGWVDTLAELFSWVAIGFLIAQAGSWFGKDNFIVALALGAAAATLFPNFVAPVKNFIKAIFVEIFLAVSDLIEFLGQWLAAIAEHFQGNVLRAIIRMVALAAFMWVWNLARQVPVIADLIDLITDTAGKVTAWVNAQLDAVVGSILQLRDSVRKQLDDALGGMGELGKALREDILGIVNQLFNGLAGEFQQLRYELVGRLDVVGAALRADIEVLGVRIRLVPQEVVAFLRARFTAAAREEERRLREAQRTRPPAPVRQATPWVVVDEARAEVAAAIGGVALVGGAQGDPFEEELRRLVGQAPPYLQGWLNDQVDDAVTALEGVPTTTAAFVDATVAELQAVLAGAPPVIPDLPGELLAAPPPAPPAPEEP